MDQASYPGIITGPDWQFAPHCMNNFLSLFVLRFRLNVVKVGLDELEILFGSSLKILLFLSVAVLQPMPCSLWIRNLTWLVATNRAWEKGLRTRRERTLSGNIRVTSFDIRQYVMQIFSVISMLIPLSPVTEQSNSSHMISCNQVCCVIKSSHLIMYTQFVCLSIHGNTFWIWVYRCFHFKTHLIILNLQYNLYTLLYIGTTGNVVVSYN